MLMPMMFIANLSIVGAAAGCYFKEKSQKERSIVLSSVLSGILGITEPALFGVLTKYKKGFLAATIGSCVGSAFIGAFGVRLYGYIERDKRTIKTGRTSEQVVKNIGKGTIKIRITKEEGVT